MCTVLCNITMLHTYVLSCMYCIMYFFSILTNLVSYQEVGENINIARPSEVLHKLKALIAAMRTLESYSKY